MEELAHVRTWLCTGMRCLAVHYYDGERQKEEEVRGRGMPRVPILCYAFCLQKQLCLSPACSAPLNSNIAISIPLCGQRQTYVPTPVIRWASAVTTNSAIVVISDGGRGLFSLCTRLCEDASRGCTAQRALPHHFTLFCILFISSLMPAILPLALH